MYWVNRLLRRLFGSRRVRRELEREYEWRDSETSYHRARAPNACVFAMRTREHLGPLFTPEGTKREEGTHWDKNKSMYIYVVATSERIAPQVASESGSCTHRRC